ncbi:MAG: insulinase family protein [Comamonadaceae bacterium]|nr:insulinase family protein [Comamonadaceae bacterium]
MIRAWFAAVALALIGPGRPRRAEDRAASAGITAVTSVEGIAEYRLANGLQVLLVPDDSKPTTTVNLTYRVGSRHENYGETGMAHLLEHLLFKGTPTHAQRVGRVQPAAACAPTARTWFDRTNYFASFSANDDNLRWYLGWLADAMVNSFIARADLDTEMTVVRNEMETRREQPRPRAAAADDGRDVPVAQLRQERRSARAADVENVDIARLQAFYRPLLPARQRDADRLRPLRHRARRWRWMAQSFGAIPQPAARAASRPTRWTRRRTASAR